MNEKGNRYSISALTNKRATLAGEIVQLERQIRSRKASLQHVDACLRLLDPTLTVEEIPNRRIVKHVNLFRQGELSRLVMDTLRDADGRPLRTLEIVAAIMEKQGIASEAHNALRVRVRSNLGYLERRGRAAKIGDRQSAKWCLPSNN
jgi:hypothetical protein